jgi:hypothetical protein
MILHVFLQIRFQPLGRNYLQRVIRIPFQLSSVDFAEYMKKELNASEYVVSRSHKIPLLLDAFWHPKPRASKRK